MGYLVIARAVGERIAIGDDIEIFISDICRGRVDIAIKAPRTVKIDKKPRLFSEGGDNGHNNRPRQDLCRNPRFSK